MQTLRIDLHSCCQKCRTLATRALRACEHWSPRRGILRTHLRKVKGKPELCLHYDPALISGEEVRQLARAAGADVHARVGHHLIALRAVAGEDAGRRIEQTLSAIDGVLPPSTITVKKNELITNQSVTGIVSSTPGTYTVAFDLEAAVTETGRHQPIRESIQVAVK